MRTRHTRIMPQLDTVTRLSPRPGLAELTATLTLDSNPSLLGEMAQALSSVRGRFYDPTSKVILTVGLIRVCRL